MQISVCCSGNISGLPQTTRVTIFVSGNNRHIVHYYADIIFMLTSVYGNYYLVMGRVCITVNLLIGQNNIL